jgi:hypothetical protein
LILRGFRRAPWREEFGVLARTPKHLRTADSQIESLKTTAFSGTNLQGISETILDKRFGLCAESETHSKLDHVEVVNPPKSSWGLRIKFGMTEGRVI